MKSSKSVVSTKLGILGKTVNTIQKFQFFLVVYPYRHFSFLVLFFCYLVILLRFQEFRFGAIDHRFFDEFDLLGCFRFYFGEIEFVSAIGTVGEFEFDDCGNEFGSDGLSKVLFVSFLCSDFSLAPFFVFWFGRFNDIGGGRFRGVAGVLLKFGNECFEFSDFFERGFEQCFEFGDAFVFPIHEGILLFVAS